ncbi:helix-turn-helix transcriptional regulator [Arenibaculum sp.]|uniref:helix-turn-helix transcriptional regulator n=1 Tax=Arenibaculum sp. TaxID=2865862 RepID=UPI002E1440CD|nr:LuxR C-terminal-related transcriptional regulator [Arenibaculum sp.]
MRLFDRFIAHLAEARSLDELRDAMQEASHEVGVDAFAYVRCETARLRSSDRAAGRLAGSLIIVSGATPRPMAEHQRLGAVVERAAGRHLPFLEEWEGACPGAARTALIVPVYDNVPGRLAVVTFAFGNEEPVDAGLRPCHVVLHAMSVYLHAHASRLADSGGPPRNDALTPRELQCLQWAARGKSRTDVGQILGLSPRTIKFHLENARRKLGAAHTGQAVLKAAMLGLVTANQAQLQRCTSDTNWHFPWQRYPRPRQPIGSADTSRPNQARAITRAWDAPPSEADGGLLRPHDRMPTPDQDASWT